MPSLANADLTVAGKARTTTTIVALATATVVGLGGVVACGATGDEWAGRGSSVTLPNEPAPSKAADLSVTGVDGIQKALESRVVATGGLIRPVKSECDTTTIRASFTCRVTYLDEVVTYAVTTEHDTGNLYRWKTTVDTMVATRPGIEAALWRTFSSRATAITCDDGIPDKQRVAATTTLPQRCYMKPTQSDIAFGKDSSNHGRTVAVRVTIYDGSIGFREETQ